MKKICFICPPALPFPPVRGGAVETLLELFINENEKTKKYDIQVFSIYDERAERLSKEYRNTRVIYVRCGDVSSKKYRLCSAVQKATGLRPGFLDAYNSAILQHMRAGYEPDLCIAEGGNYRDYANISRRLGVEKMAMHIHAVSTPRYNSTKIYGSFVFVSGCSAQYWQKKRKCRAFILPNAIDEEHFSVRRKGEELAALRQKLGLLPEDFVVLYCGRLIEEKGVLELVKAINGLSQPNIKLVVVGSANFEGALVTDYQKELQRQLNERIRFTGYVPHRELSAYYQMADMVATPSICMEAAPLVNIEAMMSGKAILTTSQGGILEYVDPDGAKVIAYHDDKAELVEKIRQGVLSLYHDRAETERMGRSNKAFSARFGKSEYFKNYSEIIDTILERNHNESVSV